MKIIGISLILIIILIIYKSGQAKAHDQWGSNICSQCRYNPVIVLPDGTVSYLADDSVCAMCDYGCNFEVKDREEIYY